MHIWNVLHAAHLKIQDAKKSPSGHQCTNLSGYVFATKACIDNWEKNLLSSNISSTYPHNMANFGPLTAEIVREFGTPQQISFASWLRYCSDVAHRIPTKLCTIFGRLLGWYTMYTFLGAFVLQRHFAKIHVESQVLRSPILPALLRRTWTVGVSRTLRRGTVYKEWNYGTLEVSVSEWVGFNVPLNTL